VPRLASPLQTLATMAERLSPPNGIIGTATLPEVVRDLWKARASGTLVLERGGETKRLVFQRGDIVFAATNVEKERLGERLVREGKIKRSVLELALRVMERSSERLGTTMVEWGWVSSPEMGRAVATQIKDIIYSVFSWSSGQYRFEPEVKPVPSDLVLELRTAEVIYEGARRVSDLAAIEAGLGAAADIVGLAKGGHRGIPITQEDGYILARIDGRRPLGGIVAGSPLGKEETQRRLYAMLLAGVIERRDRPAPVEGSAQALPKRVPSDVETRFRDGVVARHAAMKFGSFYDRLGIVPAASEKRIREAYEDALRSLEPDVSFAGDLEDLSKRMEQVRASVTEAFEALADPERRRVYDRSLSGASSEATVAAEALTALTVAVHSAAQPAKPAAPALAKPSRKAVQEAELYFLEANRHWQAGDYFDAIASINEAVRLNPDKANYHRVLGRWLAENPSCGEAAREHFERAIALDPADREAQLELAKLFENEGEPEKARGIYQKLGATSELPRH
jgi:curved DNA-binding protein CbpA